MDQGKLPPQAIDMEIAVLGAIMLDISALDTIIPILKPEMFYKEQHSVIMRSINNLYSQRQPVDILSVVQQLKKDSNLEIAGGAFYISGLTNRIASTASVDNYARVIIEKYYGRELIKIANDILNRSYQDNQDIFELLNDAESSISSISKNESKTFINFVDALNLSESEILKRKLAYDIGEIIGIPAGFNELTRYTGGWQPGNLILIAARPSRGKSALAIHLSKYVAKMNRPVALFQLEMNNVNISDRVIMGESGIDYYSYKSGNLNDRQWELFMATKNNLSQLPILLDDTPSLSIFSLRSRAKRMVEKYGVKVIVVDYIQLMTTGLDKKSAINNREQEVSYISRNLKAISKELNVPVIALSQLSRQVEQRQGKRPQLSDLRESGAIEQDADIVIFPYNPFKDGITAEDGSSLEGQVELIIAKHRNGPTGSIFVGCNESMTLFYDL